MRQGEGRSERGEEGTTVTCQTDLLLEVLRKSGSHLLMLVKLELFIERNRFDPDGEDSKFVHGSVTAVVNGKGMSLQYSLAAERSTSLQTARRGTRFMSR